MELLFARLCVGRVAGWTTFTSLAALAGFAPNVITSVGQLVGWSYWICAALAIAPISLIAAYIRGRLELIPETVVAEIGSDEKYVAKFCDTSSLREACELTKPYYGAEYIEGDIAEQWRLANKKAFVAIRNAHGELCASFGVLPLEASFMKQFIEGKLTDHELDCNNILPPNSLKTEESLYVSGVVVAKPDTFIGSKYATVMLWCMLKYIKQVCSLRSSRRLYALAVSKNSERLLKNLGFTLKSRAKDRKDKFNLYELNLSVDGFRVQLNKLGDYSRTCTLQLK